MQPELGPGSQLSTERETPSAMSSMTTSLFEDIDAALDDFHAFYEDVEAGAYDSLICETMEEGEKQLDNAAAGDIESDGHRSSDTQQGHGSIDVEDLPGVTDMILDWTRYNGFGNNADRVVEDIGIPRSDSPTQGHIFEAMGSGKVRSPRESLLDRQDMRLDYFELDFWRSCKSEQSTTLERAERAGNRLTDWTATMDSDSEYSTGTTVSLRSGSISETLQRRISSETLVSPATTASSRPSTFLDRQRRSRVDTEIVDAWLPRRLPSSTTPQTCNETRLEGANEGLNVGRSFSSTPTARKTMACPKTSRSVTETAASLPNYSLFPKTTPLPAPHSRTPICLAATSTLPTKKVRSALPKLKESPAYVRTRKPKAPKATPKNWILPSLRGGGPANPFIGANKRLLGDDKSYDQHRREIEAEAARLRRINQLNTEDYALNVNVSQFVDPETARTYIPESSWDMTGASMLSRAAITRPADNYNPRTEQPDEVERMRQEIKEDYYKKAIRVWTLKGIELEKIFQDETLTGEEKQALCAELEKTTEKRLLEAKREAGYEVC